MNEVFFSQKWQILAETRPLCSSSDFQVIGYRLKIEIFCFFYRTLISYIKNSKICRFSPMREEIYEEIFKSARFSESDAGVDSSLAALNKNI